MGSNEIGFNSAKITFGIEVEVVEVVAAGFAKESLPHNVQPEEKILHDVAQRLTDDGLEVELICEAFRRELPSYTKWVVTEDISIIYDPTKLIGLFSEHLPWELGQLIYGGVEIISPVLQVVPSRDWKAEISNGDRREFPFPTLLNIASVLVLFEPVIERWVHPGHRGVTSLNEYIKSNRKNAKLEQLTNLQVFERIIRCKTIVALQHVVNHAPGTKDVEDLQMWVLFCTTLVRAAGAIDDEKIREMASKQQLELDDLRRLVGDKIVNYYKGKFFYKLL
ncbi:hypothetical protein RUND412_008162 [Rhizina undulata]